MTPPTTPASPAQALLPRVARWLAFPVDTVTAALLFLSGVHLAVTSLRVDRGWSQDLPAFFAAAFAGLAAATVVALWRKRPIADARAFVAIAAATVVFARFRGLVPPIPSVEHIGHPPALREWYLAATAAFAAAMAWLVPVRPVDGFLLASLVFASPATRILLRWAPDGFEVAPVCLALAAAVHARSTRPEPLRAPRLAAPALAFATVAVLSAAFTDSQQAGVPAAARTVLQALGFLVAAVELREEGRGRWLLHAAACVATAISASELWAFADFVQLVGLENARLSRLQSFGIHPNLVAPYSALGAVLCLGSIFTARGLAGRAAAGIGWLVGAAAVYLHHSGGATAGLAAGSAIALVAGASTRLERGRENVASAMAVLTAALPAGVFVAAMAAPLVFPRLEGGGESGKVNVATRIELWRAARRALQEDPFLGLGPRNSEAHAKDVDEAVEANIDWSNHPHDLVVEVAETLGFSGLFAFLALAAGAGACIRRGLRNEPGSDPALAAAATALLATVFVDGAIDRGFAEFAVVPDMLWLGFTLASLGAPASAGPPGDARRNALLGVVATGGLVVGGLVPLACSTLEQSAKWLHFWNTNAGKYDTFRDPEGRLARLQWAVWIAPYRPDLRMTLADALLMAGRRDEAMAEAARAGHDAPATAETLQRVANFYLSLGNPPPSELVERAREIYQRTTRIGNPEEHALGHLGLARCLGVAGRAEEALDELALAISQSPLLPITTFGFRRVGPGTGDPAVDVVYRIAGPAPLSVTGAAQRALDRLRPGLDTEFNRTWGPMARLAEALMHAGRADLAIAEFTQIEAKAPSKRVNLPSILAQAKMAAGRNAEAVVDLDRAIANGGGHPTLSGWKARALDGAGRPREALAESQRFLNGAFDAHSFRSIAKESYRRLGYTHLSASQYDEATQAFARAASFEDSEEERVRYYMDAATAATRGSFADRARTQEYTALVDRFVSMAAAASGELEWGYYDHAKLTDLGYQLGRAAPARARAVYDRLVDELEGNPAAGAFSILFGLGQCATDQLQGLQKPEEANEVGRRNNQIARVIMALTPRGLFKS